MQALTSSPAHPHIHNHSSSSYRGQPGLSASCAHPTARAGHNPRYSQHKGRSRICHATKQQIDAVVADLDACVQGLEVVTTAWAFQAAQATNSGGSIAGSPGVTRGLLILATGAQSRERCHRPRQDFNRMVHKGFVL